MKIHSLLKSLLVIFLLAVASPVMAASNHEPVIENREAEAKATRLKNRLEEIKALDKRHLSPVEKKALRVEVREIKKELASGGGVYLSVGAIILIVLLLILLL